MKILGTVLHTSSHKNLIVRGDEKNTTLPRLNSIVLGKKMHRVGKVNDIFGPAENPYFSVRVFGNVDGEILRELKNNHVYLK